VRIPRRPGQKEDRYGQLFGDGGGDAEPVRSEPPRLDQPSLDERVRLLEEAVAAIQSALAQSEPGSGSS
jgi:uncharacterized protein YceH (UPF0502 family)